MNRYTSSRIKIEKIDLVTADDKAKVMPLLAEVAKPSYQDSMAVLTRDMKHCNKLYLARLEDDGTLLCFFMTAWNIFSIKNSKIPTIYMGLCTTSQQTKNTGIYRLLFHAFITDARRWEQQHSKSFLLWYTTASPSAFYGGNLLYANHEPTLDGKYTSDGAAMVEAICMQKKWSAHLGKHPFVLHGIVPETRYSEQELARIQTLTNKKNFTLFSQLNIDETKGDRLLCICRIP